MSVCNHSTMTVVDLKENTDPKNETTAYTYVFWHIMKQKLAKSSFRSVCCGPHSLLLQNFSLISHCTFYPSSLYFLSALFYLSHLNFVKVFLFGTFSLYSQYFISLVTHLSVLCHSLFFLLALCPPESLVGQDSLLDGPLLSLPTTGGLILASSPSSLPAPSMDQFTTTALSSGQSHQGKNHMHSPQLVVAYVTGHTL